MAATDTAAAQRPVETNMASALFILFYFLIDVEVKFEPEVALTMR